jgi:hypothetical protein
MLVCNVSQRARRAAIAADIAEMAAAVDLLSTTNLDAILAEAASAGDTAAAAFLYSVDVAETAAGADAPDATVTAAPTATTWNPSDKSSTITLSGGDLIAASNTGATIGGVRGSRSITTSKAYCEIKATYAIITDDFIGVAPAAKSLTTTSGVGSAWVDIFGGWMYINSGANSGNIGNFNSGDVLCVALDMSNKRLWFRRNAGTWNNSGTADPATNTGGFDVSALFTSAAAFPIAVLVDTGPTDTLNAGASAFAQTMPSGFVAWNSAT